MIRLLLSLACAAAIAANAGSDPEEVLHRVIDKVRQTNRQIPNYTCVETVERRYHHPLANMLPLACSVILDQRRHPSPGLRLRHFATDRLRLDVAMLDRGEIFSWAGASHFEDHDVARLVHSGPIGTGAFGAFLRVIFEQDVKKFVFQADLEEAGKLFLEYSFQVAEPDSHYRVRVRDSWIHTAYGGTFLVDPAANTVARMVVEAAEMPSASGSCMTTSTLDFANVRLGDAEYLLARQARQRFVSSDGRETENITTFADCREYRGDSTVSFETPGQIAATRVRAADEKPRTFPPGLRFRMALATTIDSATAAAGDTFVARLLTPLRDPKQKLIAPAGSWVHGRLLRVQMFHTDPRESVIVLRPESVEAGGATIPLFAIRDQSAAAKRKKVPLDLPEPGEDHAGAFRFAGDQVVVPMFFRSDWSTVRE